MPAFARVMNVRPLPATHAGAGLTASGISALVLGLALALPGAGRAEGAPPAADTLSEQGRTALQHLLQPQAGSSTVRGGASAQAAAHAGVNRAQVVVRPGEGLDRIIARTLKDSPFRVEVLRQAYMRVNRSAFPRATPQRVPAGATLLVPTVADVLEIVDPQRQLFAAPVPVQAPPQARSAMPLPDTDRRNWVRYP